MIGIEATVVRVPMAAPNRPRETQGPSRSRSPMALYPTEAWWSNWALRPPSQAKRLGRGKPRRKDLYLRYHRPCSWAGGNYFPRCLVCKCRRRSYRPSPLPLYAIKEHPDATCFGSSGAGLGPFDHVGRRSPGPDQADYPPRPGAGGNPVGQSQRHAWSKRNGSSRWSRGSTRSISPGPTRRSTPTPSSSA